LPPGFSQVPHFAERGEDSGFEDFRAVGAIAALDVRLLIGLARLDEHELNATLRASLARRLGHESGPAVTTNSSRVAMQGDQLVEDDDHTLAWQRLIDFPRWTPKSGHEWTPENRPPRLAR
jgi:hypothetical protein